MSRRFAALTLLALVIACPRLRAQVEASATKPFSAYGYALASGSEHEMDYGHALGGSGGIVLQHSRWMALDMRGSILRARVPLHTYIGEAGPRVSRRYGPMRFYLEGLGGLGHSGYRAYTVPLPPLRSAYGAVWSIDGGLDLRVTPRFQWRVADYNYSHIYAGSGAKPAILSTGVVYRFF
ncbi:MAG TPA: hypothetical protein VGD62_12000 [Acidobacteriaceae bacterium]